MRHEDGTFGSVAAAASSGAIHGGDGGLVRQLSGSKSSLFDMTENVEKYQSACCSTEKKSPKDNVNWDGSPEGIENLRTETTPYRTSERS